MMELLEELTPLNLISLALAVTGIIISLYLYQVSKREKLPVFNMKSFNLLSSQVTKVEGLEFSYKGRDIDNLTLTKIALWNQGKEPINSDDIAPQDKLKVVAIGDTSILEHEVIFVPNPVNNFKTSVNSDCKTISLSFDYFHFNEGIVISLYHTGKSSDDIKITGTIKGVNEIKQGAFKLGKYQDAIAKKFIWQAHPAIRFFSFGFVLFPLMIAQIFDFLARFRNTEPKEFQFEE